MFISEIVSCFFAIFAAVHKKKADNFILHKQFLFLISLRAQDAYSFLSYLSISAEQRVRPFRESWLDCLSATPKSVWS